MSTPPAKASTPYWGMLSLGSGLLALFTLTAGCVVGASPLSLPLAIFALVAAHQGLEEARRGASVEMSQVTMGIVLSTLTLGSHFILAMAGIFLVFGYVLMFLAAFWLQ